MRVLTSSDQPLRLRRLDPCPGVLLTSSFMKLHLFPHAGSAGCCVAWDLLHSEKCLVHTAAKMIASGKETAACLQDHVHWLPNNIPPFGLYRYCSKSHKPSRTYQSYIWDKIPRADTTQTSRSQLLFYTDLLATPPPSSMVSTVHTDPHRAIRYYTNGNNRKQENSLE